MAIPNKVVELYRRYNEKFPIPVGEGNVRDWIHKFNEQCAFSFPGEGYCTKAASSTRPISKDTTTKVSPPHATGYNHTAATSWDMVLGAGTANPRPIYGSNTEHDIHNPPAGPQYIYQVNPVNHLGDIIEPPIPPTPPNPDRQKLIEVREDIDDYLKNS